MKEIHSAIHKAGKQTSLYMTGQLRKEAKASGWPRHVIRNMGVVYNEKKFEVHVHDNHLAEAHTLEYGTETTRPTAAIRRSANNTREAEQFFLGALHKMVGKI